MLGKPANTDVRPNALNVAGVSIHPTGFWHGLVWIAAGIHCVMTAALSLTRLYTNKASLLDLGVFDQALWTTLTYGTPTTTINYPHELHNWFGFHFSPIVLFMVPIYALAARPELLVIVQSILIAVTAVPIFWTCCRLSGLPRHAFFWSVVYLLNPFLLNGAAWDFHEKSFALPAFALAYFGLVARRRPIFILAMVWLLLCQEHYGLAVLGFGILWMHLHAEKKMGLLVGCAGLVTTIFVVFFAMPLLNPAGTHPMIGDGNPALARYAWLSEPPAQLIDTALRLMPGGLLYVLLLLLPSGSASIMAPMFLIPGMADFGANFLSLNPMPRTVFSYHSMVLVLVLVMAAARGTVVMPFSSAASPRIASILTLVLGYLFMPAPVPLAQNVWQIQSVHLSRDAAIEEIQAFIRPEMRVSAQSNIGSFFSQRRFIYPFPARLNEADAVILHFEYPYADFGYAPYANPYPTETMRQVLQRMEDVVSSRDFGILFWERNWLLAIRGAKDRVSRDAVRRRVTEFLAEYDIRLHNALAPRNRVAPHHKSTSPPYLAQPQTRLGKAPAGMDGIMETRTRSY